MRVIGLAGWSGSGKTTLLTKVIPVLVQRGHTVSTVKHAHHQFDTDLPGKDSHTHRVVGAQEVFISSPRRWAQIHEVRRDAELMLPDILRRLSPVDLVIIEGYKAHHHPKLEVHRAVVGKPLLYPDDPWIVALASDAPVPGAELPVIDLDDVDKIIDVLLVESMPVERILAAAGAG
jgi:molybdopterin-guanine dinucleotide biosynthesis adapter protein